MNKITILIAVLTFKWMYPSSLLDVTLKNVLSKTTKAITAESPVNVAVGSSTLSRNDKEESSKETVRNLKWRSNKNGEENTQDQPPHEYSV